MAAVTELRRDYPLAALLKLAGIPRSTYYYHSRKANAVDKYAKERAEITAIIRRIKDGTGIGGLVWNYATEAFV